MRWSHSISFYDIGLAVFHGTRREPKLLPVQEGGKPALQAYYLQMTQASLDLQVTVDACLWKLESLYQHNSREHYWAAQGGFEYTMVGLAESVYDLGLLMELGWDQRGQEGDNLMQRDLFVGARLAFNDMASTEALVGLGYDLDYGSYSGLIEASHRLAESWLLSIDGRFFNSDDEQDPLYSLRRDDHIQLNLEWFF